MVWRERRRRECMAGEDGDGWFGGCGGGEREGAAAASFFRDAQAEVMKISGKTCGGCNRRW